MQASDNAEYSAWLRDKSPREVELAGMRHQQKGFVYRPLFTICLLVSNMDEIWIKSSLDSVLVQTYPEIEVVVLDNGCERTHVAEVLREYSAYDGRVKCVRSNRRLSRAKALEFVTDRAYGDFLVYLSAGDTLAPEYVFAMVEFMQHVTSDILYCDEDQIDITDIRSAPRFKPYWSPDLLREEFYVGGSFTIRSSLLKRIGGFSDEDEVTEYGMLLRASELTTSVHHVPGVMYSRRNLPSDRADKSDVEGTSGKTVRQAIPRYEEEHINRAKNVSVILMPSPDRDASTLPGFHDPVGPPNVNVEVLTVGFQDVLDEAESRYVARSLNSAAKRAIGEVLIFVNESSKVVDPEKWLTELLRRVDRASVGGVSCKATSSQGQLRYGGTLPGVKNLAGFNDRASLPSERLLVPAESPFNPLMLNPYCFAIRKDVFERVGGFDEENCPSAFYTLDLARKLRKIGLLNAYVPDVTIACDDNDPFPAETEASYIWEKMWCDLVAAEYYASDPLGRRER